ncbi:hypothetical protein DPMN_053682 [Dreissena polymorpha]|uniref:Uncharacterized protein n=1 Tax=Dreissena polymorpha TaxID=45954 RepID=A0A9D4CN95_DREPO|nr:hypothetical protein DPMN_053682 [Dreissena polymorpha]
MTLGHKNDHVGYNDCENRLDHNPVKNLKEAFKVKGDICYPEISLSFKSKLVWGPGTYHRSSPHTAWCDGFSFNAKNTQNGIHTGRRTRLHEYCAEGKTGYVCIELLTTHT